MNKLYPSQPPSKQKKIIRTDEISSALWAAWRPAGGSHLPTAKTSATWLWMLNAITRRVQICDTNELHLKWGGDRVICESIWVLRHLTTYWWTPTFTHTDTHAHTSNSASPSPFEWEPGDRATSCPHLTPATATLTNLACVHTQIFTRLLGGKKCKNNTPLHLLRPLHLTSFKGLVPNPTDSFLSNLWENMSAGFRVSAGRREAALSRLHRSVAEHLLYQQEMLDQEPQRWRTFCAPRPTIKTQIGTKGSNSFYITFRWMNVVEQTRKDMQAKHTLKIPSN